MAPSDTQSPIGDGTADPRPRWAVVLGGAGFLGQHVVQSLLAGGWRVRSIDRDPRGRLERLGVDSLQADLRAGDRALRDVLGTKQVDAVVCLIGTGSVPRSLEHPLGDLDANIAAPLVALEALRDLDDPPTFVYASSAAVYGEARSIPMAEDHPREPVSPYGVSKLAAERYVSLYHALYDLPSFSVRPFSLYGPGQRKLVVYDLMRRLRAGEAPLTIAAPATVTRDLVYVRDAAAAIVQLLEAAPAQGEVYNISSGRGTSLATLAATLIEVTGSSAAAEFTGMLRAGDPHRWEGDPSRAAALGASCDTPLDEGLRATVEWFEADLQAAV